MRRFPGRLLLWLVAAAGLVAGLATSHYRWAPSRWLRGPEPERADPVSVGRAGPSDSRDRRPGLWHLARSGAGGAAAGREALDELADLPYMSGYEVAGGSEGVVVLDRERTAPGVNLVVSGHAPAALLIDAEGRRLHAWSKPLDQVWPELARERDLGGFETFWRRAHLLPDGGLLAIYDGIGLVKLDADSGVVWARAGGHHHDLHVEPRGTIHALIRRPRAEHPRLEIDGPIEEDFVVVHSADGEPLAEYSILDSLIDSPWASLLALGRREGDILHTNTLELMDGRFEDLHPLYRRGNVLVSIPRLDTVAVIDPAVRRVIWAITGLFRFQHQPTVLDNGNLLVFDNTGAGGDSRVLEIEPLSQEIVWRYEGDGRRRFTSYFLGSVQPLANGNVLVTESTAGRAFEITRGGEIVWEYVNPHRAGEDGTLVASLLEVVRIPRRDLAPDFRARIGGGEG